MKYSSPSAFRTALEERLRTEATQDQKVDPALLNRLRKRVTFERFLARLQEVAGGAWVLKGGFALELRLENLARTTKDIDVDWSLVEGEAVDLLLDSANTDLGDYFVFRVERVQMPPDIEGQGQRWRVTADLAGKQFETVLLDIGLEKHPLLTPVELALPDLLAFAGLPSVSVPSLSLEQHLAEKVHAYTQTYGADDSPSSRIKDLIDVALVAVKLEIDGRKLRFALTGIFEQRGSHELPSMLPPPPIDWDSPWRSLVQGLPLPEDAREGYKLAGSLIDPVLASGSLIGRWSPDELVWLPPSDQDQVAKQSA